jgi:hypothetical protein
VVALGTKGVIFSFKDRFAKEDERPWGRDVVRRPPFLPNAMECVPCVFGVRAFEQAVLRRFEGFVGPDLTSGGDPHALELGANREATVQVKLDEGAHFARVGVVPDSSNYLGVDGVLEVELPYEGVHVRGLRWFPHVPVTPFCQVIKERRVP